MDELLRDFLTESAEQWAAIGSQLSRFERDPYDARIVANIFRLVHSINGACGFLNLPRLGRVARGAECLIDGLRDGATPHAEVVATTLAAIDRIKDILASLAEGHGEPPGDDDALLADLERASSDSITDTRLPFDENTIEFGPGPAPLERRAEGVRVSAETLDRLTSLVTELTLAQRRLPDASAMTPTLQKLSCVADDLQSRLLSARVTRRERLRTEPEGSNRPTQAGHPTTRSKVLVVEPSEFFRVVISDAIEQAGFEARTFADPQEALTAIGNDDEFVAIFVDLEAALAGSGEFARRLRGSGAIWPLALIGLASHGGPAMQALARGAGLTGAIGKFDRTSMLTALEVATGAPPVPDAHQSFDLRRRDEAA